MTLGRILMRPLHIIHLQQDDPKKCTARMLARRELAVVHERIGGPRRGILLDPLCGKVLGPEDRDPSGSPLIALDCSWKSIEPSIKELDRTRHLHHRTLPLLLAASPVSWGKPGRLSTAEAFGAALWLLGEETHAKRVLGAITWGDQFLKLNLEPLNAYRDAETSAELVQLQYEFFD